ncbi:MAG: oxidoreductase [Verrucomicrobiales bacterium]|nr:oxidoreductase [Verrucomicrobiales bacterium]|tara:strand:+ start:1444 stop:2730 length:1287 start_codon:yes stop_codon:yes gene_type:complete
MNEPIPNPPNRRGFIRTTSAATIATGLSQLPSVHAAGSETLRLGLIGCGGRGTGAADNALKADPKVKIVAMADVFPDRMKKSADRLKHLHKERFAVEEDHRFIGFDSYQKLLASDVDVVILATPPHFRPEHLQAVVAAGKHAFVEKPVAVDAVGARSVLETCRQAKGKGLSIVSGLMLRYSLAVKETMKRIHDGAIGRIVTMQANYNIGGLWSHPRQDGWSDMDYQLRNWYYYTWLSGDHIVEQHVHGLDMMAWAMRDQYPVNCFTLAGRQSRTEQIYGHIFDHFAVCYEYANGERCFSFCRQQNGTDQNTAHLVYGSDGTADLRRKTTTGNNIWRYSAARNGVKDIPYQLEHDALFRSIRNGEPINNGDYMVNSTMMAIMGRQAGYTGKTVTWEQAWKSREDLRPDKYAFGDMPYPPVAIPGQSKLI